MQTLITAGGVPTCLGVNSNVPTEDCNNVRACNWAVCNSLTDPYCNLRKYTMIWSDQIDGTNVEIENCTDPNLGSQYFCGACQSGFCAEVSTFAHCEYATTDAAECAALGGSFNGLQYMGVVKQKCIRPTMTQAECSPPQFCASVRKLNTFLSHSSVAYSTKFKSTCGAKCYAADITSSENCTTTSNNVALTWQTWNVAGQSYGLCVTTEPPSNRAACTADPELSWWCVNLRTDLQSTVLTVPMSGPAPTGTQARSTPKSSAGC